jgi:hypothetical protein
MNERFSPPEKKLVETGVNEAGYPEYESRTVDESEVDLLEAKEKEGWLSVDQSKGLRTLLATLALSVPLKDTGKSLEEVEEKPLPTYVQMKENEHNRELHEALDNETAESRSERALMDSCIEQTGSIDECLDGFSKQVKEYAEALSDSDIRETAELASKVNFDISSFETRSEPDTQRDRPAVPESVQSQLRHFLLGWIAQESRFRKDAVSKTGAESYAQFKPYVYKEYRGTENVSRDLDENLNVMGDLASDNYHYIVHYAEKESIDVLRGQFDSEQDFMQKFMSFNVLTSHNSGGPILGKALKKFVEQIPQEDMKRGQELFSQFIDFAYKHQKGFGVEPAQYAAKVLAMNSVLQTRMDELESGDSYASVDDSHK